MDVLCCLRMRISIVNGDDSDNDDDGDVDDDDDNEDVMMKTIPGFHMTSSKLKNKELSILLRFWLR